jgi:hypothetical protein
MTPLTHDDIIIEVLLTAPSIPAGRGNRSRFLDHVREVQAEQFSLSQNQPGISEGSGLLLSCFPFPRQTNGILRQS